MSHSEANRKGSFLERRIAKLFSKIGFETKLNSKEMGFETDVLARKRGFNIIIEAKQYESYINVKSLLHEWSSKGKSVGADKTLLIVTGLKNISESDRALAKRLGVYLWDEEVIHNLHDIENKEELYKEIGKRLEFIDVIKKLEERARKVMLIKLTSIVLLFLIIFFLFNFYMGKMDSSHKSNLIDNNSDELSGQKGEVNVESIKVDGQSQNQQKILEKEESPEDILISFCIKQFKGKSVYTSVRESNYFTIYEDAHNWAEQKIYSTEKEFEQTLKDRGASVEFSVQQKMRKLIEPLLDKAEFPVVIIDGEYQIQKGLTASGIYICDKNGILDLNG